MGILTKKTVKILEQLSLAYDYSYDISSYRCKKEFNGYRDLKDLWIYNNKDRIIGCISYFPREEDPNLFYFWYHEFKNNKDEIKIFYHCINKAQINKILQEELIELYYKIWRDIVNERYH